MDKTDKLSRAIDGSMYSPGIVGMNNIKANDYCNVVLQVRCSVIIKYLLRRNQFVFFFKFILIISSVFNRLYHMSLHFVTFSSENSIIPKLKDLPEIRHIFSSSDLAN